MKSARIFISYARENYEKVITIYNKLMSLGAIPWMDKEQLVPGESWDYVIHKEIRKAEFIIICLSNTSINKPGYIQNEIEIALELSKQKTQEQIFLIPVMIEKCEIPDNLSHLETLKLFEKDGWSKLILSIEKEMNRKLGMNKTKLFIVASENEKDRLSRLTVLWANDLLKYMQKIKYIEPISIIKKDATRKNVELVLHHNLNQPGIFVFIVNSTENKLLGSDRKPLIDNQNVGLLKNKFIYAIAPDSVVDLGKLALNKGICGFIGFHSLRIPGNAHRTFGQCLIAGLKILISEKTSVNIAKQTFELECYKTIDRLKKKLGTKYKGDLNLLLDSLYHNMNSIECIGEINWKIIMGS